MKKAANRWLFVLLLVGLNSCSPSDPIQDHIAFLKDQNENVRKIHAQWLGELHDARAVEPLIACLKDQNQDVRGSAAAALGKLGDARAVEPLIACLNDQNQDVRKSAADALAAALVKLGNAAVDPLIACLNDQNQDVRKSAVAALGKLGDARAVEPLIACLKDQNEDVRDSAADALGKLGDVRASAGLLQALLGHVAAAFPLAGDSDWSIGELKIYAALQKLGWKPTSDTEEVSFWLHAGDHANLQRNWEKTKRVLLAEVQSGNDVERAVHIFLSLGKEEIVPDLIRILDTQGNKEMAETYLNCGHDGLAAAARSWAFAHGYLLLKTMDAPRASWGSW